MAEDNLNPRGQIREDFRNAQLCTVVARSMGSKTAKVQDFMPDFENNKKQTKEEILTGFKMLSNAVNENNKRRR